MRLTRSNYCAASMRNFCEWLGGDKDAEGRWPCAVCGKVVLLRKDSRGWRNTVPTHTSLRVTPVSKEKV
jgi:hypothetical protein